MGYIKKEVEEAVGKKWTRRFIGFGIAVFVYIGAAFVTGLWPFSSLLGVIKKTTSPAAIVQNYEWFYDQYHAIEAQRRNIEALPEGSVDRTGTQMVLNNMIAEYNAKSQELTRNLWKTKDLPYKIGE